MSHSYLARLVDRKTKPCACLLWLTLGGRETGNDSLARQVRLEVFAHGCMLSFKHSNIDWSLYPTGYSFFYHRIYVYIFSIMCSKLSNNSFTEFCSAERHGFSCWGVCVDRKCSKQVVNSNLLRHLSQKLWHTNSPRSSWYECGALRQSARNKKHSQWLYETVSTHQLSQTDSNLHKKKKTLSGQRATHLPESKYHFHIHKTQISFSYGVEIDEHLKAAIRYSRHGETQQPHFAAPSSRYLGATWNPRQAPVALTPYGLRKILPKTIKGCFFFWLPIGFISSISLMSELILWQCRAGGMQLMRMWVEMGALRNGPLFGNSLSAALEMRDAYRSFQLEAFCVASHGEREELAG